MTNRPRTRILITAGPTHEPIDAVRYLANRSSGKLGLALAAAARDAGWAVTLLLGPVADAPPHGVRAERFETTDDLAALLAEHFDPCDLLVMAAAVSDFRPARSAAGKIERGRPVRIDLEPTPDLIAELAARRRPTQRIVGFALEPRHALPARAAEKLQRKQLDAIVANPLETMGSDRIEATVLTPDGTTATPGPLPKDQFAPWLITWCQNHLLAPQPPAQ